MQLKKILFIISLFLIWFLLFLTIFQKPLTQGTIKQIKYSNNLITLQLQNQNIKIIIFTNQILNLKQGNNLIIYGKQETYKGNKQIIADKITYLSSE